MASQVEAPLIASAAYTTTQTADPNATGAIGRTLITGVMGKASLLEVIVDTTTVGTGSVTVAIEGWVEGSGAFRSILASAAITTVSVVRLVLGPDVVAAANAAATGAVPNRWRVVATANNGNTQTYSVTGRVYAE